MPRPTSVVAQQVLEVCRAGLPDRAFRRAAVDTLARALPFDAFVWVLTDPHSCVGVAPLAMVPSLEDLPRLIRAKYLSRVNRWTQLPTHQAVTLAARNDRDDYLEIVTACGVHDVLSIVLRDAVGCWAFIDLWRLGGTPFDDDAKALAARLLGELTIAQRTAIAGEFVAGAEVRRVPTLDGAVLLMDDELKVVGQTPAADAYLRALLPPDTLAHPVPAAAYNVAAQLLAAEAGVDAHPATGRVPVAPGEWLTLNAARIDEPDRIAVTLRPATPSERAGVFASATGLSDRESQLLHLLLTGDDTRRLARRLVVTEYTVQDHLKAIFRKTGTRSRAELVARVTGS